MSVLIPTTSQSFGPVTTLHIIKAIEKLGGSRGYIEYLRTASSVDPIPRPLSLLSASNSLSSDAKASAKYNVCSIKLHAGCIPGILIGEIKVYDELDEGEVGINPKHTTQVCAYLTRGSGCTDLQGTMYLSPSTSWEEIVKGSTKLVILAEDKKGAYLTFSRDCEVLAVVGAYFPEATGVQDGSYLAEADCTWEEIVF